ncbi:lipase family protein [Rhodococcoides trifolii]|uniref:lipase family protein n=1 Tax=Rhodococcoides trifolii TaxID=908250 RepID=UPI001667F898|nr:lipase family protein [Rhodococcus trifolii]
MAAIDPQPTTGPGHVESSERLFTTEPSLAKTQASITRVVYTSTSGVDGSPTQVSGVVAVPPGAAPEGGWPIVSFAHGTTGVKPECGPSVHSDLYGSGGVIATLVARGYVVAATDYQGLGVGSGHPYLEPITAANNVIDAVRAARTLVPDTRPQWLAYGGSQGGQAAWAAAEQAPTYAPELPMVGSVATSPALDLEGLADAAIDGTPSTRQVGVLPLVLTGMTNVHPDRRIDDYMRNAQQNLAGTLVCAGDGTVERDTALQKVAPTDFVPATDDAARNLRSWLRDTSLPKTETTVPILVLYGGKDDLVLPNWVDTAVNRACGLGDIIDSRLQPDSTHRIDTTPIGDWVADRFAGRPVANTCEAVQ